MKRLTIIIALLWTTVSVWANQLKVHEGQSTLREAIDKAAPGDTIYISKGHYREGNIIITKPIALVGIDFPTFDGENKHEVFTVNASDVSIEGLHIINTGMSSLKDLAAIGVNNASNVWIANNHIENAFFGIHLANCAGGTIENNRLRTTGDREQHAGNGIHLWNSRDFTIRGNTVDGHRDGIYFEFVTESKIIGNTSQNNIRYGLHFMFSHNDEYTHNLFRNNGAGIAVMYSNGVTMTENQFVQNWGASVFGLLLKEISGSTITRNYFYKNTVGIYMEGCSRSQFQGNEFRENGWAIKLQASCDDNLFERNNFIGNSFDMGTNGSLALNTLKDNHWDKYPGYDLDHNGVGDIPFHPVTLYSKIVETMPTSVMLWRSFLVFLLDRAERVMPVMTPENVKDDFPKMTAYDFHSRLK
ncbi:MAG: nitrous oxide reductase family maturation protein NosD [Cyclobacteriaceae bacterium]